MRNPMMDLVIKLTGDYFGIEESEVTGESKKGESVIPRHISIYLIHKHIIPSKSAIARYLGLDHSSVIHAINAIENYKALSKHVQFLEKSVVEEILNKRIHQKNKIINQFKEQYQ